MLKFTTLRKIALIYNAEIWHACTIREMGAWPVCRMYLKVLRVF